jgi:4-hydroxy-4-methyl-2-oxoglutarate aldolase
MSALTAQQLTALRRLSSCLVANAIETFHQRLRNEGFVDPSVRSLFPDLPPMVGYAATVRIRGSAPPTADREYPERTDWWDYVLSLPAPRVLVVQDVATSSASRCRSAGSPSIRETCCMVTCMVCSRCH